MEELNKNFVIMFSLLQLHTAAVTYRSFHHPISQPGHKLSGCNHGGAGSNADYTLKHGKLGSESDWMDPLFMLPPLSRSEMDGSGVKKQATETNNSLSGGQGGEKKKLFHAFRGESSNFKILNMLLINGAVAMDGRWQKSDNNVSNKGGSDGNAVAAGSGLPARGLINEGPTIQGWFYSRPCSSPPSASKVDYSSTNSLNINQTGDTISPRNVLSPRPKWESKNMGET